MNKNRRKEIEDLHKELDTIKCRITDVADEEQEYFDCMPENLQSGERGEAAEGAVDNLQEAACCVETALEFLNQGVE